MVSLYCLPIYSLFLLSLLPSFLLFFSSSSCSFLHSLWILNPLSSSETFLFPILPWCSILLFLLATSSPASSSYPESSSSLFSSFSSFLNSPLSFFCISDRGGQAYLACKDKSDETVFIFKVETTDVTIGALRCRYPRRWGVVQQAEAGCIHSASEITVFC